MLAKTLFIGFVLAILLGFGFLAYDNYNHLYQDYQLSMELSQNLSEKSAALENSIHATETRNSELESQLTQLQDNLTATKSACAQTSIALDNCLTTALQGNAKITELEGNVLFKGGTATVNYHLLDGSQHSSTMDVRSLNNAVNEGFLNRYVIQSYRNTLSTDSVVGVVGTNRLNRFMYKGQISPVLYLKTSSGSTVNTDNYMAFEDTASVASLANYIRQNSKSDIEFVENVLYVKSQLNDYTYNIVGEPRYPLETFLEGGGDCGASS